LAPVEKKWFEVEVVGQTRGNWVQGKIGAAENLQKANSGIVVSDRTNIKKVNPLPRREKAHDLG